jgi:hypothetical protein
VSIIWPESGHGGGAPFIACHLEPRASDFEPAGPAHADSEAQLSARRITAECDQFHHDADDAGCVNESCMCWCHP